MRTFAITLLCASALSISACAPTSLSGSGMMRVEVDVYKGPVGTSHEIQQGELITIVNQAAIASDRLEMQAAQFIDREADGTASKLKEIENMEAQNRQVTSQNRALFSDLDGLEGQLNSGPRREIEQQIEILDGMVDRNFETVRNNNAKIAAIRSSIAKIESGKDIASQECKNLDAKLDNEKTISDSCSVVYNLKKDAAEVKEATCQIVIGYVVNPNNTRVSISQARDRIAAYPNNLEHCNKTTKNLEGMINRFSGNTSLSNSNELRMTQHVSALSAVSAMMQNKARRAADANISFVPSSNKVRELSANLAYTYSEFAKNISSRTLLYDNLAKRCERDKDNRVTALRSQVGTQLSAAEADLETKRTALIGAEGAFKEASDKREEISSNPSVEDSERATQIDNLNLDSKKTAMRTAELAYFKAERKYRAEKTNIERKANEAFNSCVNQYAQLSSKLPTSAYLRDVEPTRYLDAFKWFDAETSSGGSGIHNLKNRITGIRALNAGLYWEKVNEVYASGQGNVSMAFVKDELGNWNLKSYTNDPAELLDAYRGGFDAVLKSAVKTIRKASGDPTALAEGGNLLDIADRLATGRSTGATNIGGVSLTLLHDRTNTRLNNLLKYVNSRTSILDGPASVKGSIAEAEGEIEAAQRAVTAAETIALPNAIRSEANIRQSTRDCGDACADADARLSDAVIQTQATRTEVAVAKSKLRAKQNELAVRQSERKQLGGAAAEKVKEVLEEHRRELLTLQKVVATENASQPVPQPQ